MTYHALAINASKSVRFLKGHKLYIFFFNLMMLMKFTLDTVICVKKIEICSFEEEKSHNIGSVHSKQGC